MVFSIAFSSERMSLPAFAGLVFAFLGKWVIPKQIGNGPPFYLGSNAPAVSGGFISTIFQSRGDDWLSSPPEKGRIENG